jgi:hypothetical protein
MVFTLINLSGFVITLLAKLAMVLVQNLAELASAPKAHI